MYCKIHNTLHSIFKGHFGLQRNQAEVKIIKCFLQIFRHASPLHLQTPGPATGACVVAAHSRRAQTRILRLHRGVRVGQRAGVVQAHRRVDHACGRGTGKGGWLSSQPPWLKWTGRLVFIGHDPAAHWRDGQTVASQRPGRQTVFPLGGINDVFGQNAVVGFGVLADGWRLAPGFPVWRCRRGGGRLKDGTWRCCGCYGLVDRAWGRACCDVLMDGSGWVGDWCGLVDWAGWWRGH